VGSRYKGYGCTRVYVGIHGCTYSVQHSRIKLFFPFFFNFFFGRETRIEKRYALSIKSDLELQDYVPKI
jgi:hypothetical protein